MRSASIRLIVLLVGVLMFQLSCRDSGIVTTLEPLPAAKDSIIALRVGNRWLWHVTTYALDGGGSTYLDSMKIDSAQTAGSDQWFFPSGALGPLAFANRTDGCYYKSFYGIPPTPGFLFYKYPARRNDKYKAPQEQFSGNSTWIVDTLRMMTVLSTDTTITSPAGTFQGYLYRYERTNGSGYSLEFLAPSVGWVRVETYARTLDGQYFRVALKELVRFVPGPP
jgi:hypothetical protein